MTDSVVIASGNVGKIREIRAALAEHWILALPSQTELGISAAVESHPTFLENALAKARHVARHSGMAALADDSGLVVPALGDAPGVYSARYAGANADDAQNNAKLLAALTHTKDRAAYYYAAIIFITTENDPMPIVAEGCWRGEILREQRGSGGFGYDPLFYDPKVGKTGAEMSIDEKQQVSHRGQSLRYLVAQLKQRRFAAT